MHHFAWYHQTEMILLVFVVLKLYNAVSMIRVLYHLLVQSALNLRQIKVHCNTQCVDNYYVLAVAALYIVVSYNFFRTVLPTQKQQLYVHSCCIKSSMTLNIGKMLSRSPKDKFAAVLHETLQKWCPSCLTHLILLSCFSRDHMVCQSLA